MKQDVPPRLTCWECPFCLKELPDGNFTGDCGGADGNPDTEACEVMVEFADKLRGISRES